jgi:hypothetical protein
MANGNARFRKKKEWEQANRKAIFLEGKGKGKGKGEI